MSDLDAALKNELEAAYQMSLSQGLWTETDLALSKEVYLSLLAKIYFDPAQRPEAAEIGIQNRADLKVYDPAGYAITDTIFRPALWPGSEDGQPTLGQPDPSVDPETHTSVDVTDVPASKDVTGKDEKPAPTKGQKYEDSPPPSDDEVSGDKTEALKGGKGTDMLVGGDGFDKATLASERKDLTIKLEKDAAVVVIDRSGDQGTDYLLGIEELEFMSGDTLHLDALAGVTQLFAEDLTLLVELYIAYFNRAPDAEGLYFWGNCLSEGMAFNEVAAHFFDQPETQALYGDGSDSAALVNEVYNNCLGREADVQGFSYWSGKLSDGSVSPDQFILALLNGAKEQSGGAADATYLQAKTDIGLYFAVTKGLSDTQKAKDVMSSYDGGVDGIFQAKEAVDEAFLEASSSDDGDLILSLVGVVTDPFADF